MTALAQGEIAADVQAEIGRRLAWGFPSPDSDDDVRFVHARPVEGLVERANEVFRDPVRDGWRGGPPCC